MSGADDDDRAAASIQSSPWLFFPWQTASSAIYPQRRQLTAAESTTHTSERAQTNSANNSDSDNNDSIDNMTLTQFPPYGSSQQKAQHHPDIPPDWLNHLSHLSNLSTLSEQQQALQSLLEETESTATNTNHENFNKQQQQIREPLEFDWDPVERDLWSKGGAAAPQQNDSDKNVSAMPALDDMDAHAQVVNKDDDDLRYAMPRPPTSSWRDRRRQRHTTSMAVASSSASTVCTSCHRTCSSSLCIACRWKQKTGQTAAATKSSIDDTVEETTKDKAVQKMDTLTALVCDSVEPQQGSQEDEHPTLRNEETAVAVTCLEASKEDDSRNIPDTTVSPSVVTEPPTRKEGNIHLGSMAAEQLQLVARHLLPLQAPLLWNMPMADSNNLDRDRNAWIQTLLTLATQTISRVDPNVKQMGDLLDICPHVKIKTIAGGRESDCAYFSGVMFRKTISHKVMRSTIESPRILLLQGGIEFYPPMISALSSSGSASVTSGRHGAGGTARNGLNRSGSGSASVAASPSSNRRGAAPSTSSGSSIAGYTAAAPDFPVELVSLDTLMEHEDKYMDRLIRQLLQVFNPDVIIAGGSVCRIAQERLSQAKVTVISHVKPNLLQRVARQTTARVLTPEGIKNLLMLPEHDVELAALESMVGKCHRFRLVAFRDNEIWTDSGAGVMEKSNENVESNLPKRQLRSIDALLADPVVLHHDRQAALVARQLGQGVLDGSDAVKAGLAKRGVAQTFVMLEGCPKHLGCTVVLRGADKQTLKEVKVVFRFLVNVAYNLRLETSYLRERGARIRPDFHISAKHAFSSSLCVDYGGPPVGKKVRPWNGSNAERIPRTATGEITAFDHQSILITSVWMTQQSQCCPAEVKGICYYSMQDVALGQFLRDSCFNLSLKCQNPNCKKSVLDHSLSFVHNDGLVNITVEELDDELQPPPSGTSSVPAADKNASPEVDRPICTWSFCRNCDKVVSSLRYISEDTWKFSFGKFLETFFYNRDAVINAPDVQCSCGLQSAARLHFGCGKLAAQFNFEPIRPFGVFVRRTLPMHAAFQREEGRRRLETISKSSSALFVKFDKQIEKISRETRSLFNSATVRPEHLQTVLSELNKMSTYVDDAAKSLQDRVASVSDSLRRSGGAEPINAALFRFPWFARRYLFMLTYAWNEKLSAAGQAITTMKKMASSASTRDGGLAPNVTIAVSDPLNDELMESMKQLRKLNEHYTRYNMADITQALPPLPENDNELQEDGDFEDDFDKDESPAIYFADGVDADVVASRRRLQAKGSDRSTSRSRPVKSLGTRRSDGRPDSDDPSTIAPKATPGGAVKSALNRFFNRGGRDQDLYTVDLGVFADGRPRLAPGLNGIVVPVFDDQLSTIIAYSLSSTEYAKQFKYFSRHENLVDAEASQTEVQSALRPHGSAKEAPGANADPSSASEGKASQQSATNLGGSSKPLAQSDPKSVEHRMLVRSKSHVKHTFRDFDEKGQVTCKFVCTTYWATQFHAVRQVFLSQPKAVNATGASAEDDQDEFEMSYIESLSSAYAWAASGGKSGASFHRTSDDRFVIKFISRTELQMFLDCAPAYFEYLSKAFFHGLPTALCKIVGVYQIGIHNRVTGKRTMEQVAVMQNIFYNRKITQVFDLKGSLRGRFAAHMQSNKDESHPETPHAAGSDVSAGHAKKTNPVDDTGLTDPVEVKGGKGEDESNQDDKGLPTLLDGDFLEWTRGRPMPLTDRAKAVFQMSILNDTLFLSIINVLDYSILVGIDDENQELVVGIIDFMRQYDIMKQMERVGKSLPMVVGSEAPTIIQPPLYKARFSNAMERYFMGIPNKWTTI